jgi:hypothetical protein
VVNLQSVACTRVCWLTVSLSGLSAILHKSDYVAATVRVSASSSTVAARCRGMHSSVTDARGSSTSAFVAPGGIQSSNRGQTVASFGSRPSGTGVSGG